MTPKDIQRHNIICLGDTHDLKTIRGLLENENMNDFVLIHVGDSGTGFKHQAKEQSILDDLQKYCQDHDGYVLITQGNHDYPFAYQKHSWQNMKYDRIEYIENYSRKIINGKNFLFAGGATSIDRTARIPNKEWWPDEVFKLPENLEDLEECDVLVTHSSGITQFPDGGFAKIRGLLNRDTTLEKELVEERKQIQTLVDKVKPKLLHVWGHFHDSNVIYIDGAVHRCLDINEMWGIMHILNR